MAGYRLTKLPDGTHVSYWPDPRGPNHGTLEKGVVLSHLGDSITIDWYDGVNEGITERWSSSDLRYRVDRGQVILKRPTKQGRIRVPKELLACKVCGTLRKVGCDCPRPRGALKPEERVLVQRGLTKVDPSYKVEISNEGNALTMRKGAMMATKKKAAVVEDVELEELEELEAVNEETEVSDTSGMLSAKAAATALGTDGRTLRKFLRKKNGVLGQGKRWEIDPDDLDDLRAEFAAFSSPKAKEATEKPAKGKKVKVEVEVDEDFEDFEDADIEALEELDGPDEDELEEIEFDEDDD